MSRQRTNWASSPTMRQGLDEAFDPEAPMVLGQAHLLLSDVMVGLPRHYNSMVSHEHYGALFWGSDGQCRRYYQARLAGYTHTDAVEFAHAADGFQQCGHETRPGLDPREKWQRCPAECLPRRPYCAEHIGLLGEGWAA